MFDQVHDLIRMAFPGHDLLRCPQEGVTDRIWIELGKRGERMCCRGIVDVGAKKTRAESDVHPVEGEANDEPAATNMVRRFLVELLNRHMDCELSPYGTLTGVRPVKIVHRLLDRGWEDTAILDHLFRKYLVNLDKARLLLEVARANRPFLPVRIEAPRLLSVYIGIPFCPSRCHYCSFPGNRVRDYEVDVSPYISALLVEMEMMADAITENGWGIQSVYLGGGTPTILSQSHLEMIFTVLHDRFISGCTSEITMEAGRPDSVTKQGLNRLREMGVNRICINPQTMEDETLKLIGRQHDSRMVVEAAEWARQAGIEILNMDLILGLPGENLRNFQNTARRVMEMEPDNITLHTLASKRGSQMFMTQKPGRVQSGGGEEAPGLVWLDSIFRAHDYRPYYLYRQKYMQANLENTGYERGGRPCIYNIQMIEERQTIIGMGGGAGSKFVRPGDWSLTSFHNPQNPQRYVGAVHQLISRKVDKLRALN